MGDIANPRERQQAPEAAPDDPHGTVYDQGIAMFEWLKMAMGVLAHYDTSANSTVIQAKAITDILATVIGLENTLVNTADDAKQFMHSWSDVYVRFRRVPEAADMSMDAGKEINVF
eukprot:5566736-Pyramimonas_sp.AAC.1